MWIVGAGNGGIGGGGDGGDGGGGGVVGRGLERTGYGSGEGGGGRPQPRARRTQRRVTHNEKRYHSGSATHYVASRTSISLSRGAQTLLIFSF